MPDPAGAASGHGWRTKRCSGGRLLCGLDQPDIQMRLSGDVAGQIIPTHLPLIGEMPNALFPIQQQVERGMHQIGDLGGRHLLLRAGDDSVAAMELVERVPDKIIPIPRPEKGTGADDEALIPGGADQPFCC